MLPGQSRMGYDLVLIEHGFSAQAPIGSNPERLIIHSWLGGSVQATNVTVSCMVPSTQITNSADSDAGGGPVYLVDDAVGMINAIVAAQSFSSSGGQGKATLLLRKNVTFIDLYQPNITRAPQVVVSINLTIVGSASGGGKSVDGTVVDWNLMNWVLSVNDPSVQITFSNMTMTNLCALRGLVAPNAGYFGLFASPFWVVW